MEENLRLLAEKLGLSVRFSDAGLIKKIMKSAKTLSALLPTVWDLKPGRQMMSMCRWPK